VNLDPITKILITVGILLIIGGVLWQSGLIQVMKLGRLPGDIVVERESYRFYFPIVTSLILSALLSGIFWLLRRF
jgi:hypothetical protein